MAVAVKEERRNVERRAKGIGEKNAAKGSKKKNRREGSRGG